MKIAGDVTSPNFTLLTKGHRIPRGSHTQVRVGRIKYRVYTFLVQQYTITQVDKSLSVTQIVGSPKIGTHTTY